MLDARDMYPWLAVDEIMILLGVSQASVYRLADDDEWPKADGIRGAKYSTAAVLATLERRRAEQLAPDQG